MSSQEEVLISDWVPPSWEEIVREHSARVYRLAYRLTGNPHDAEDLTQTCSSGYSAPRPVPARTFEGWLHRHDQPFLDGARRRRRFASTAWRMGPPNVASLADAVGTVCRR
jgi:RNA polymerase sigma-70 factor (ECF subfamily)